MSDTGPVTFSLAGDDASEMGTASTAPPVHPTEPLVQEKGTVNMCFTFLCRWSSSANCKSTLA